MKTSITALFAIIVVFFATFQEARANTTETLPAGTYIIPMDNTHQNIGSPFNLRAYGLAVRLLHAGVPLKWVINPTKAKDGIDFTAPASRIRPSAQASQTRQFRSGPLAVHPGFEAQALQVINGFGNNVAVFQLSNAATVNVYATILHKPKVAVFNQGGKSGIHTSILSAAGMSSGTHYVVVNNANNIGAADCLTLATEPHSDNISQAAVNGLLEFLRSGGNFFGQCAAVRGYTQRGLLAGYQTDGDLGGSMRFDNFSDPMAQFQGGLANEGGSVVSFKLTSDPGMRIAYSSSDGARYKAYVGRVTGVNTNNGGWVHYLAGHDYQKSSGIENLNGQRMLLNAVLRPSDRPANCNLSLGTDYYVTKVVNNATPEVGQNVTFTIVAGNTGPLSAQNVVVNDLLPSGLTYVSHTTNGGTYTPATGVWNIGTLAVNATRTLTLTATATSASIPSRTNTATITSTTPDSNPNNNTASATVTPRYADIRVVKSVDNSTPSVGQNVTFSIVTTNLGPDNATGVVVNDLLPAGLTYVSHSTTAGLYSPTTGVWTIGSLNVGVSRTLTITANVTMAALPSVTNSASVTANQFDPFLPNNFSNVTVNPQVSDLAIVKSVDNGSALIDETVTFTLVATNNGPSDNNGVVVNDLLPAGLTYVSHSASVGSYNPATGDWIIGDFASGATASLTLVATVTADALPFVVNTATIGGNIFDPDPTNNTDTETVSPGFIADIGITKTVDNATPFLNGQATFTLTAFNLGPADGTAVVAKDVLPAGLAYISHSASVGNFDPVTGNWTIGDLNVGDTPTLTITVEIQQEAVPNVINIATISGEQFDPDPTNNIDDVLVTPDVAADLEVVKTVNVSPVLPGEEVVFTIVATNNGPSDATFVVVNDQLPLGLEYLSHTVTTGTFNPGTGNWTIGNLANGQSETLTITARASLDGGLEVINVANITGRENDPDPENNSSAATVTILSGADLAITKTASNPEPLIGETVIYTIVVSNSGPQNATDVVVTDELPDGLINPTNISGGGVLTGNTITWPPFDLAVGDTVTFTLEAAVAPPAL